MKAEVEFEVIFRKDSERGPCKLCIGHIADIDILDYVDVRKLCCDLTVSAMQENILVPTELSFLLAEHTGDDSVSVDGVELDSDGMADGDEGIEIEVGKLALRIPIIVDLVPSEKEGEIHKPFFVHKCKCKN